MKKILKTIIALTLVCIFSLFAMASGSDDSGTENQGTDAAGSSETADNALGDFSVEIKSSRLAKDYEGKDVIIVTYGFTNNSADDATAFYLAFTDNAYQNGVGLNEAYVLDDSADYNADNQTKEIKKGGSLDVEVAYELNDNETDVLIEVEELFSFSDKIISKTFTIK